MEPTKVQFDIQELLPIGFTLIVLGLGIAYGLQVLGDLKDEQCIDEGGYYSAGNCWQNSTATTERYRTVQFNATQDTVAAVAKIPAKLGTVVTVIMAAVVIGVLLTYLYARFVR